MEIFHDKLWNDTKPLLLRYVNLDRGKPFTEGDLFVGLLSLATQIIHRADRNLWTLACNFDSLNRTSKNVILRSTFMDSDTLEMSNLPKVLDSVKLELSERPIRVLLIYIFMVGLYAVIGKLHTWFLTYKDREKKQH